MEEHLENLREVLRRLLAAGFRLNLDKCEFFKPQVKYLGHIINKDGLSKDTEKIKAIVNLPSATDFTEVKAFIGMINFYMKFIPNLAEKLEPLYDMQKEKNFVWSDKCNQAFIRIKKELVDDKNLVHYDQTLPVKLVTDASNVGVAATLLHIMSDGTERPIAWASRVLRNSEKNYSTIHKEALAIFWSVGKFYQYLMGREFTICSDSKPLTALFNENKAIPVMAAGRLQRWALFLSGFNYKLEYIKGSNNIADGILRIASAG